MWTRSCGVSWRRTGWSAACRPPASCAPPAPTPWTWRSSSTAATTPPASASGAPPRWFRAALMPACLPGSCGSADHAMHQRCRWPEDCERSRALASGSSNDTFPCCTHVGAPVTWVLLLRGCFSHAGAPVTWVLLSRGCSCHAGAPAACRASSQRHPRGYWHDFAALARELRPLLRPAPGSDTSMVRGSQPWNAMRTLGTSTQCSI